MRGFTTITFLTLITAVLFAACTPQTTQTSTGSPPEAARLSTAALDPTTTVEAAAATEAISAAAETPQVENTAVPGGALVFSFAQGEGKARYRVREQLVNLSLPNDAIGETEQVSGSVTIRPDGSIDSASSRFEVNLASLVSDQNRRDNFVRSNLLQTDQYPSAVFVPKNASGLTWPPVDGAPITFQLTGDLTIRNVTREVTWDVSGTLQNGQGTGQAVTTFTFADFSLTQPRVPVVLSIEDPITLEVDGTIRSAGNGN